MEKTGGTGVEIWRALQKGKPLPFDREEGQREDTAKPKSI